MGEREDYLRRLKGKLQEWSDDITSLEREAEHAGPQTKEEFVRHLEEVRQAREELRERYEEMESASEQSFQELRAGSEDAWRALDDAFRRRPDRR